MHLIPNIITLSRIPFLFIIVGLLYSNFRGAHLLALVLYIFGSLSDWLDGFLARKYNVVSNFGKLMDALIDKVFVVGICIALLATSILPSWTIALVLIILTREFFVTGLRLAAASQGHVLAAEKAGKIKTLTQIVSMGLLIGAQAFWIDLNGWPIAWFVNGAEFLGLAMFFLATALTLYSGWGYLSKYGDLLRN
jgi:CDP-diacylglycerol---glycerol-3-phosphate 3-phosphatidyltransferase